MLTSGPRGSRRYNHTRIKQLEKWMEEAMPIYQAKSPAPTSELPQIR